MQNSHLLAIFFWILSEGHHSVQESAELQGSSLLFSFEFCSMLYMGSVPLMVTPTCYFLLNFVRVPPCPSRTSHSVLRLAIFFWILFVVDKQAIVSTDYGLLFSFEFCDRECRRRRGAWEAWEALLFSFEFCLAWWGERHDPSGTEPCYFLLNFVEEHKRVLEKALEIATCYFLLNFVWEGFAGEVCHPARDLLFSFEFCVRGRLREWCIVVLFFLAIFFWIL